MKKIALGIAAATCLVLTGCGAGPGGQALNSTNTGSAAGQQSTATASPATANTVTTDVASNSTSNTSSVSASLQPYTGFQQQGLTVRVPQGWVMSTDVGGNYKAVTFSNPSNSKEQVRLVYSTCVGCYMAASGKPDPTRVIGAKDPTNVQVSKSNALMATYDFTPTDSQYPGTGIVQVSNNESGYAEIDVVLSNQNQALRAAILQSFHYAT